MASTINGQEAVKNAEIDSNLWQLEEEIKNCTVQILVRNGEYSIGWWRNE